MSNFDYTFRLNKQVERKIIIDILSQLKNVIDIANYTYIGMGAIFYYDFVQFYKSLGIKSMFSIESRKPDSRFVFNKPYDFIEFIGSISTEYLNKHNWNLPSIVWLDYETSLLTEDNDFVISDLKILGKNCKKNDIIFITINAQSPSIDGDNRRNFLLKYKKYISPQYNDIKNTARSKIRYLIQNIFVNILAESCEYNQNKFYKFCSFDYKDGAEMYTLGGIFLDNYEDLKKTESLHHMLNFENSHICNINAPAITQKERHFLNQNLKKLSDLINQNQLELENSGKDANEVAREFDELLSKELPFKLPLNELKYYVEHYRYIPNYFEGIV